jgi:hypothetical protein
MDWKIKKCEGIRVIIELIYATADPNAAVATVATMAKIST